MSEVAKRDNLGKIDFTLIPLDAEEEEALVWMSGEQKYGRSNWEKLWGDQTLEVVMQSLLRHANALRRGEVRDQETGLQHAAHIRCNAAMLIRYFNLKETRDAKQNGKAITQSLQDVQSNKDHRREDIESAPNLSSVQKDLHWVFRS